MSEQFTKGPWNLVKTESGDFDIYSDGDCRTHIALVPVWDAADEAHFNAALISRSPEMYFLLQVIQEYFFEQYGDMDNTGAEIKELLAKARGES